VRPELTGSAAEAPESDPVPASEAEAEMLFDDIKKTLREETLAYRQAKQTLAEATEEDMQDAWFAAQLALTRLSRTASRLDMLGTLEMPPLVKSVESEAEIIETFVVGERQQLFALKP
jgi:hypothetical protein